MALCHEDVKAHLGCSNRFPSFGDLEWVSGPSWAKTDCFGAQNVKSFWEGGHLPTWRPRHGVTNEFGRKLGFGMGTTWALGWLE